MEGTITNSPAVRTAAHLKLGILAEETKKKEERVRGHLKTLMESVSNKETKIKEIEKALEESRNDLVTFEAMSIDEACTHLDEIFGKCFDNVYNQMWGLAFRR